MKQSSEIRDKQVTLDRKVSDKITKMKDEKTTSPAFNKKEIFNLKKSEFHDKISSVLRKRIKKESVRVAPIQKKDILEMQPTIKEVTDVKEIWLASDVEDYEEKDLLPGEMYTISLASMSSDTQACLQPQTQTFLTKPGPAGNLKVTTEERDCIVTWSPPPPPGHSCLEGYRLEIRKAEDDLTSPPLLVKSVKKSGESLELIESELGFVSDYRLSLFSVASGNVSHSGQQSGKLLNLEILRESSPAAETSFTLSPLPPLNLRLESASHSSLKVKWDPSEEQTNHSYIISTRVVSNSSESNPGIEEIKVNGTAATLSNLDSGQIYQISVATVVNVGNIGKSFKSKEVSIESATKPMPPTDLRILTKDPNKLQSVDQLRLAWKRSASVRVTRYELTIKSEDEYHREKYLVDGHDRKDELVFFLASTTMEADTDYKINVFSLIEHGGELVRSDPLQARVCNGNRVYRLKSKVQLAAKRKTMSMSDLTMQVILKQQF